MIIREIQDQDIEAVSIVCLQSFSHSIANSLSEAGSKTFSHIASSKAFRERLKEDNLIYVAEENQSIKGVIELKAGHHIAMLFVEPKSQMKGIGKKLVLSALSRSRVDSVTVSASLSSVPAYEKYGFRCIGDIAESAGLVYQPMQIELNKGFKPEITLPWVC